MTILILHQTLSSQVNLTGTPSTPRPPPPPSHTSAAGQGAAPPLPSGIASPQGGPRVGARVRGVCAAPRPLRALGLRVAPPWPSPARRPRPRRGHSGHRPRGGPAPAILYTPPWPVAAAALELGERRRSRGRDPRREREGAAPPPLPASDAPADPLDPRRARAWWSHVWGRTARCQDADRLPVGANAVGGGGSAFAWSEDLMSTAPEPLDDTLVVLTTSALVDMYLKCSSPGDGSSRRRRSGT
ncbi:hypothetical protein PVAP13_5KG094948 [Panicum virgatum]|uniref:Uncharacterized protein n=1 Tax=Panicum virgatum TaxID=38727 RepID=A0A8T0SFB8_PANVG|nr:hypothetical protein PVAP13_5KG094948 [Panicum virgatum]